MFTIIARLVAKPDRRDALDAALRDLVARTRAEEGCLRYDLHVSIDDPCVFLFYEEWASEAHWHARCETPAFVAHRAATRDLVASAELSRVEPL